MSKSQAPAPPGQPTHGTKIRIIGAEPGTPEFQAVLDRHQGQIDQFIRAQHQRASLSGLPQHKASIDVGGVTMTYHNNQGQDTVIVDVRTSGGEEASEEASEEYWKWAIVETTIPNIQGLTSSVMSAFMTPPPNNGKIGAALDHTTPLDPDKPPLSYPVFGDTPDTQLGLFLGDVQDNDYTSSLRVDLRPYPGGVKFDLYGYIRRYQNGTGPGPNTTADYLAYRGANAISTFSDTVTTFGGGTTSWPGVNTVNGRTQSNLQYKNVGTPHTTAANVQLDWPETSGFTFQGVSSIPSLGSFGTLGGGFAPQGPTYAGSTLIWGSNPMPTDFNAAASIAAAGGLFTETTTFGADGLIRKVRGIGAMDSYFDQTSGTSIALFGAGPSQAQGSWGIDYFDYTLYWIGDHPTVPIYVHPERDCPIGFVVLDNSPDAMSNRFGSPLDDNHFRWESSKTFPQRWNMKQIDSIHMVAIDDTGLPAGTIENHFSMIKLGTVIINPRKGKGGIKFIAA